ncbi:Asp23/Gls24 family envelope stress response protein [Actinopolymorpha rutila]|uniref:Outer membrane receptor protein involved in Fe transport n=1 Tax=Actinopolymorpha rutila TaxID=446787 RepID=A0A852ZET1_9ACTN|nr:Asp23/Gls24 family envelope stress response protein [Actinopolymorpha rutila]NYH87470.1 outer membrane receptor protein involved in Fe transport [Actinopolymorpha rutila]
MSRQAAESVGTEPRSVESPGAEPVDAGRLADRIAAAVTACPEVARLSAGPVATYLPGRSVPGVAVRDDEVRVAVVARYGRPLAEIAEQVRAAVVPLVSARRVDVTIDDLAMGDEEQDGRPAAGEAGEGRDPGVG